MVSANVTSTGGYYAGASTSPKSLQKIVSKRLPLDLCYKTQAQMSKRLLM